VHNKAGVTPSLLLLLLLQADAMAEAKDGEEPEGVDVYLNLINGVINREKEMKYDNGALQYFFGVPPTSFDKGRDATFQSAEKKGEYYSYTYSHS
jgi:hypothetical protein